MLPRIISVISDSSFDIEVSFLFDLVFSVLARRMENRLQAYDPSIIKSLHRPFQLVSCMFYFVGRVRV